MILQETLFGIYEDSELYFRITGKALIEKNTLVLLQNTVFTTDTYYNSFSAEKWEKYCNLNKVWLNITIQGQVRVTIVNSFFNSKKQLENKVILSKTLFVLNKEDVVVDFPEVSEGTIFYSIKCLSDKTIFYGAKYVAECPVEREITIALNICTFRREAFILRNVELLKENFINNTKSLLHGHLKVFITDNGKTLNVDDIETSDIHMCYNPNVGGAGGFSRGLLEILKRKEEEHITNAIFMDDDIEILPETLVRTYRMLKILKNEYINAFLAGAMLRQDYKYIQYENAACWNGGNCDFINRGLDLRQYKNVVYNEIERKREYGAWWYCCIPSNIITSDNLAVPLFIHLDDIEYSLRNTDKIITLNGISVIHPVNEERVVSSNIYYDLRNMLIVNAKYYPDFGRRNIKRELLHQMLYAFLRYRYKDVRLLYKAVEDFYKGPDWLFQLDAAAYHIQIQKEGYRFEDVSQIIDQEVPAYIQQKSPIVNCFGKKKRRWTAKKVAKLIFIVVTLNGAYFPSKKKSAFEMNVSPARLFRRSEIILYDEKSKQGITLGRNILKIFELIKLYMKACRIINKNYKINQKKYRQAWSILHGRKYWDKVLQKEY
ncbi:MAG: glycosyltransferase family 2 protein [Lachnospiraceae bacterium]|nr:glycosyltransferase family 2 protein [Lachnospiraceae bacterium]